MENVVHKNNMEAEASIKAVMKQVFESGKWMIATWVIDDDGVVIARRTTCEFPREKFDTAVGQLVRDVNLEAPREEQSEAHGPLPLVIFISVLTP